MNSGMRLHLPLVRELWSPGSVCGLCANQVDRAEHGIVLLDEDGQVVLVHQAGCAAHVRATRAAALWRPGARCDSCRDRIASGAAATIVWVSGRHEYLVHRQCTQRMLERALRALARKGRVA